MAIDIGDAVLTFLGDTTQLNQVYDRVGTEAPAKMAPATAAFQGTGDAVDGMTKSMAVGATGAVELGQITTLAGEKTRASMYEARGEGMLLGEMFGIHLPRHVMSFIAELPGVGAALSSAFAATAVVFLLVKLGELIEKHEQAAAAIRHEAAETETLEIKQHDLVEGLEAANLKLEDQIRKLEGRPTVNNLSVAMMEVKKHVDELATSFAADFDKMDKTIETNLGFWAGLKRTAIELALTFDEVMTVGIGTHGETAKRVQGDKEEVAALNALIAAEEQLQKARRALAEEDPAKDMEKWKAAAGAVAVLAGNVQAAADTAAAAVKQVEPKAHELLNTLTQTAIHAKTEWQAMGKEITNAGDEAKKANQEIANDAAEKAAKRAKEAFDAQVASIEKWKSAQHAAFASGNIDAADWAVAQVRATDAAAIANEDYIQKLISIYQRSGQAGKLQAAQQELSTLQTKDAAKATEALAAAEEKHRQAAAKINGEYLRMVEAGIDKSWAASTKAAEELAKAEGTLLKSETALRQAQAATASGYKEQEEAIKKLAAFHLITEEQKAKKLDLLYAQEEKSAVAALMGQLAKQQAAMQQAQNKVKAAEGNPFFTDAQVLELRKNLALAQAEVNKTETQILAVQDKFSKQRLAEDKTHYAQVLALAIAFGKQELAEKLKSVHSALLVAEAEKTEAKARGLNVTAIEKEIAALKKLEKQAEREIHSTVKTGQAIVQLKQISQQAYQDMASAFFTATESMITGQQSFGKAMEAETFKMLASIAKHYADVYIAKGIGNLADMDYGAAALDFAAAAAFEVIGGALSGLGSNVSSGGRGGGGGSSNQASITQNASTKAGGPTTSTVNVPHLGGGALVTRPTLLVAGDQEGGSGDQTEAIIPLGDSRAKQAIMELFGEHGGGAVHNHFHIQGMIGASNLVQLSRMVTRGNRRGTARVTSSNSSRLTRNS